MGNLRQVHLVSVVGAGDPELLPHLIRYYSKLGIESFRIACHAESDSSESYERLHQMFRETGISPVQVHLGPWRETLNMRIKASIMSEAPDDWFVVADLDEFHVYDRPLHEVIELCEQVGADHVNGCFMDRVGLEGELLAVDKSSIWERFPLAGSVSSQISRAMPLKTGLARGHVELLSGHHGTSRGHALPRDLNFIQVHHFKWTRSIIDRLCQRLTNLLSPDRRAEHCAMIAEARAVLDHLDIHGGRINVADKRFHLAPCAEGTFFHPHWRDIMNEAEEWRWKLIRNEERHGKS
ncbi:glycosyltransferase family 2 protein [Nonomuraea sp. NPDC004297]